MPNKILTRRLEKVFLTSPSDVSAYRKSAKKVINKINKGVLKFNSREFRLLSSESVTPDYGETGQSIISKQIGNDYSLHIIIFWTKIGSHTGGSISGTVKEFKDAVDRFEKTKTPRIMIFRCLSKISPKSIDPDQLKEVNSFFQSVEKKSYYKEVTGTKDFESKFTHALENYIQDLEKHDNELLEDNAETTNISGIIGFS